MGFVGPTVVEASREIRLSPGNAGESMTCSSSFCGRAESTVGNYTDEAEGKLEAGTGEEHREHRRELAEGGLLRPYDPNGMGISCDRYMPLSNSG